MNNKDKTDSQRQTFETVTDLPCCAFGYVIIGHFKTGFFLSLAHGRKDKVICVLTWYKEASYTKDPHLTTAKYGFKFRGNSYFKHVL